MRRWRQGEGCGRGGWAAPRKKIPKMISLGAFFPQFLTGRKHGSLGTRILQFNREITKLTKTVQNYPKIHDQTKVAVAPSPPPPEYATEVIAAQRSW